MKSKTINQHEEVYIHLPKQSFKFFLLTILLIALTIGSFYVTIESWTFLELGDIEGDLEIYHLLICPILIFDAILIVLTLFSLISMFYNENLFNLK